MQILHIFTLYLHFIPFGVRTDVKIEKKGKVHEDIWYVEPEDDIIDFADRTKGLSRMDQEYCELDLKEKQCIHFNNTHAK